jgi:hypothetical protein
LFILYLAAEGGSFLEQYYKVWLEIFIIQQNANKFFRVAKQIYSSYFIFRRRRRLRLRLLFILTDHHELENIFHIGNRSLQGRGA